MAVHIRLARAGAKKHPFYRIIVADQRSPRGGRFLDNIGTYDPTREPAHLVIDEARLGRWRAAGAQPSATVDRLIKRLARISAAAQEPSARPPAGSAPRQGGSESSAPRTGAPEAAT